MNLSAHGKTQKKKFCVLFSWFLDFRFTIDSLVYFEYDSISNTFKHIRAAQFGPKNSTCYKQIEKLNWFRISQIRKAHHLVNNLERLNRATFS